MGARMDVVAMGNRPLFRHALRRRVATRSPWHEHRWTDTCKQELGRLWKHPALPGCSVCRLPQPGHKGDRSRESIVQTGPCTRCCAEPPSTSLCPTGQRRAASVTSRTMCVPGLGPACPATMASDAPTGMQRPPRGHRAPRPPWCETATLHTLHRRGRARASPAARRPQECTQSPCRCAAVQLCASSRRQCAPGADKLAGAQAPYTSVGTLGRARCREVKQNGHLLQPRACKAACLALPTPAKAATENRQKSAGGYPGRPSRCLPFRRGPHASRRIGIEHVYSWRSKWRRPRGLAMSRAHKRPEGASIPAKAI